MRPWLIFGVVLFLAFVLLRFPADVATGWLAPEAVTVYGARGTIWDGEADAIDIGVPGLMLETTEWRIRPAWLLTGRVRGRLHARFGDNALRTGFSRPLLGDRLRLFDTNGILNLETLPRQLLPQTARGRVGVSFEDLLLDALWPVAVTGSVDLVDVEVVQGRRVALGSYEILFDGSVDPERGVVGRVAATDSTLSVTGSLSLGANRAYLFEGDAKAGPDTPADISQALTFLGTPAPDGSVALSFSGTVN